MHHNDLEILDSIGSNISVSNGSKVSTTIETIYCNASHQNESGMITSQNCIWAAGVEQQVGKWNDLPWTTGTHNPRHHDLFEANETHDASCVAEEWGHSTARPCHRHRLLFGRRMSCLGFGTSLTRKKRWDHLIQQWPCAIAPCQHQLFSGNFRGGRLNYCKTCKVNCSSKSLHLQWPSNKSQQVEGATRETMRLQISARSHRIRSKGLPRWLSLSPGWELDRMNQMLRTPGLPGKAGGKAPQQAEATPQHSNARDQHVPRLWREKWGRN